MRVAYIWEFIIWDIGCPLARDALLFVVAFILSLLQYVLYVCVASIFHALYYCSFTLICSPLSTK